MRRSPLPEWRHSTTITTLARLFCLDTPRACPNTAGRLGLSCTFAASAYLRQEHESISAPPQIQLRPYQEESINAVLSNLALGERRMGLSLATGSGKTVIFSHLIDRISAPTPQATRTLILAHRRELVEQAWRHCSNLYPDKRIEIEMGGQKASGEADITVASVQSITSGERLAKYDPECFKLVLVDEAHHIAAASYLSVLKHFNLAEKETPGCAALVGVSATFSRMDGLSLGTAIDEIVYHKDYVDMIDEKWLADLIFTTVRSGADLSRVKSSTGDFSTSSLSAAVNNLETNAITVRSWLERASERKSTLVFCVDLAHVAALTAMFREHGVDARFVTSDTDRRTRAERLEAFRAGEFPVLLNVGILTEGTDIPNIDCVLLARPTRSPNLLVQMIGRGLRKHEGKSDCHVIDMVASLATGIVTTPTLFGLSPDEVLEKSDATQMKSLRDRRLKELEREINSAQISDQDRARIAQLDGNVTFTEYDNVNDLIEDTSGERRIRAISPFAWVQIEPNRYVLSSSSGEFLTILKADDEYRVVLNEKLPAETESKAPSMRPRQIAKAPIFDLALRAADTKARAVFPYHVIQKNASWRDGPPTEKQVDYLNKFREEGDKLSAEDLTKGRAGDQITKIRHGARGAFGKLMAEKKRVDRGHELARQQQETQRKAQVKVGPVKGL